MRDSIISGTTTCSASLSKILKKHRVIREKRLSIVNAFKRIKSEIIKY